LSKFIKLIFAGNIFIGLCATMLCLQTFVFFDRKASYPLLFFVFFATLALYNLHSIVALAGQKTKPHPRYRIVYEHLNAVRALTLLAMIGMAICTIGLPISLLLQLVLISVPSLLYILPIIAGKRLRDISILKIFILAIIWALVTVLLPFDYFGNEYDSRLGLLLTERAIFVFAIAIAFDIRDMEFDKTLDVKTIPIAIGKFSSFLLAGIMLISWAILVHFIYMPLTAILLNVIALLSIGLIYGAQKDRPVWYYQILLDGTLLLQALIVVLTAFNK
jgi:4-hydroxybenzoate polyprenyltransferase